VRHAFAFGSLNLEGTWHDQSTIHFVGDATGGARLPGSGARTSGPFLSVTLTAGALPASLSLEAALAEQEREFAGAFREFRVVSREPWTHPTHGAVPQLDFTFEAGPGTTVRQRQCYFRWPKGERFSCLALACDAGAYEAARPALTAIFTSFSLDD